MPIHDWSQVDPGLFHDFHQAWTIEIRNALNRVALPPGFFALAEQIASGPIPDVLTLPRRTDPEAPRPSGGLALADSPPQARFVMSAELDQYASRANRITIKHQFGQVVAVIEIVSPGNKNSRHALRSFVQKAAELLRQGIHLLVIDLFPPSTYFHRRRAIRRESTSRFGKRSMRMSRSSCPLPVFLDEWNYVPAPLEESYNTTWEECPEPLKAVVEGS